MVQKILEPVQWGTRQRKSSSPYLLLNGGFYKGKFQGEEKIWIAYGPH